jgi:hypothetical protein
MGKLTSLLLFAFIAQLTLALLPVITTSRKHNSRVGKHLESTEKSTSSSSTYSGTCVNNNNAPSITAPKSNVWNSLTDADSTAVTKWLLAQPDLNLTSIEKAGEWDNSVSVPRKE